MEQKKKIKVPEFPTFFKNLSFVIISAITISPVTTAKAGGYLTNTNQSINFLRNPSRDAAIGNDAVYYNPAGAAFLEDGWHTQFNWQVVHQSRNTYSNFEMPVYGNLYKYNINNPANKEDGYGRTYRGKVNVPIQPSLLLSYNKNKWSFQFGFGFIGGGGGCKYDEGLGSFEYLAGGSGIKTLAANGMALKGYNMNGSLEGKAYNLGFTLGAARKLTDKLSAYIGLRGVYATNSYDGKIENIEYVTTTGNSIKAGDLLLDCKQSGFGVAPIIGFDYKINEHWNIATKFEFKTRLRIESSSQSNDNFNDLTSKPEGKPFAGYADGAVTPADMPAILAAGIEYSPVNSLRLMAGYHHYFDTDTRQWTEDNLSNTNEITLGAEYDINNKIEVSAGYQKTIYKQEEANYSDLGFSLSNWSYGLGIGIQISQKVKLNAAFFQTIYSDHVKETTDATGVKSTMIFSRTNKVFGLGIDYNF